MAAARRKASFQSLVDITDQKNVEIALKQTDRRKDEFLAMLAHELRNPLAPLRMVAEMMGPADKLSIRHDEMLQIMRHQVQVLIRLVDDLMEVSRITRGKILLQPCVVDLRKIIRDAVEISRPLIDAGNTNWPSSCRRHRCSSKSMRYASPRSSPTCSTMRQIYPGRRPYPDQGQR